MKLSEKILLFSVGLFAAALRAGPLFLSQSTWHPDEYSFIYWPLNFFSGDLNPRFFTYPSAHYYFLGAVYGLLFIFSPASWSLGEFVAYHYFWDSDAVLQTARAISVIFASGTAIWAVLLARRVFDINAGILAGILMSVSTLHIRQSPLVSVDIPMTFWVVGALWTAVRILDRDRDCDYALAGVLTGLAGGSKYPGAAIGVAVLAAHLLSRRGILDRRIWLAGGAAITIFCATSPYILLDFDLFKKYFLDQVEHVQRGRGTAWAWFYHLDISLMYSLGLPALLLAPIALFSVRFKRSALVLVIGFFSLYIAISWGELVFVRYALPLMAIQAVLAAGAISLIGKRPWRILAVCLTSGVAVVSGSRAFQFAVERRYPDASAAVDRNLHPPGFDRVCFRWLGRERSVTHVGQSGMENEILRT